MFLLCWDNFVVLWLVLIALQLVPLCCEMFLLCWDNLIVLWLVLIVLQLVPLCCDMFLLCWDNLIVLWLVFVASFYYVVIILLCCATCYHCVAACFRCVVTCFYFAACFRIRRIRISFIARYVYTYEEFVFMTEATAMQQNDSDRTKKTQIIKRRIKKEQVTKITVNKQFPFSRSLRVTSDDRRIGISPERPIHFECN